MAKDWGDRIERMNREREAAREAMVAEAPGLLDRVLAEGRVSVQYEPMAVQAATIAAVLYPDLNRASDERWSLRRGGF